MYCQSLSDEVHSRREAIAALRTTSSQRPLGASEKEQLDSEQHFELLSHLHASNCDFLAREISHTPEDVSDPRTAALMFMIAATPSAAIADMLSTNFDIYRSKIDVIPSHSFQEHGPHYLLTNIPDAVNPVKAHLAYIQVLSGDTTDLKVVWKVCSGSVLHLEHLSHYTRRWR